MQEVCNCAKHIFDVLQSVTECNPQLECSYLCNLLFAFLQQIAKTISQCNIVAMSCTCRLDYLKTQSPIAAVYFVTDNSQINCHRLSVHCKQFHPCHTDHVMQITTSFALSNHTPTPQQVKHM